MSSRKFVQRGQDATNPTAEIGDNVISPFLGVDRAKTDFRNVTGVVLEKMKVYKRSEPSMCVFQCQPTALLRASGSKKGG